MKTSQPQSEDNALINVTELLKEKLGNTEEMVVRDNTKKAYVKERALAELTRIITEAGYDPTSMSITWPTGDPFFLNDKVLAVEVCFKPIGYKRKPGKHELTIYIVYDEVHGWQLSRQWNLIVVYLIDQNGWVEVRNAKRKET